MPYNTKEKEQEYQRLYHLRTWTKRKKRHKELRNKRKLLLRKWFMKYKKGLKCIACGENFYRCLDFHHLESEQKDSSVADMVIRGYSINSINKEIGKCIVLCRNCHAKIHHSQTFLKNKSEFIYQNK